MSHSALYDTMHSHTWCNTVPPPSSDRQPTQGSRVRANPSYAFQKPAMHQHWRGGLAPQNSPQLMQQSLEYGHQETSLPIHSTQHLGVLQYLDRNGSAQGHPVQVDIFANIHKNFIMGENYYICYRRNYISCSCSFSITPYHPDMQMYFTHFNSSTLVPIAGFAMCMSAIVSTDKHKEVHILQRTPKRDKGPARAPAKQPMAPRSKEDLMIPQHLFTQYDLPTEYNFDRIQFKTATANNGERRSKQQCYRLVVELWANVGLTADDRWVKVAMQVSADIVVRGRSPGYYLRRRLTTNTRSSRGA